MKRKILYVSAAVVVAFAVSGCQSHSTDPRPTSLVKLGIDLESADLASLVNLVTLTVEFIGDGSTQVDTLDLEDSLVVASLALTPGEEVGIVIEAFSEPRPSPGGDRVLLYVGGDTLIVPNEPTVTVEILLRPPDDLLMLRAGPIYQSVEIDGGDLVEVFVDIHNVDSLWGAAFRLEYDTTILRFEAAEEGDFLSHGPPAPTFAWARDSLDYVACGAVRVRQDDVESVGVSGSGRLMTLSFAPIGVGVTEVTFVQNEPLAPQLDRPAPDLRVENHDKLELESATVDVRLGTL